ncbi:hypothetical protein [Acrocarpospora catenulata]|uniref:hypothetical protein n=1 Tax=Acrocarpospora catenulata TaxID=2836182 RepID=UPI001BDA3D5B|nr:hypothetical protein [Acrocarpospora catenulata]
MTQPLTGHRSRSDLIAELYERHAAGLFAYCHDQLGETAAAADALVAVLTSVPSPGPANAEPPRAALYALARREIYRRDVSYALPAVDSVADPATALIERVFRDIRPHQREVLLLSAVCGLSVIELSWVLDVAGDTAEELTTSARTRFHQTLSTAVSAARSAPFVPVDVAEVYDAIGVAPIEDVLARLPWRLPANGVRHRVLSSLPFEEPPAGTPMSGLPTKRLWPTTPVWPLPLKDPDQVSNTCVVQAEEISESPAPEKGRRKHEAPTEPMPRIRASIRRVLSDPRRRRPLPPVPAPVHKPPQVERVEELVEEGLAAFSQMESFDGFAPAESEPAKPEATALPVAEPVKTEPEPEPEVETESKPAEPEAVETPAPVAADTTDEIELPGKTVTIDDEPSALVKAVQTGRETTGPDKPRTTRKPKGRSKKVKPVKVGEHHYDWLWELVGFIICLAIALIVFFSVPSLVTP